MILAFGVLAALIEAGRTGRGQVLDAAMVDGAASLATYIHSMRAAGTWIDQRASNVLDSSPQRGDWRIETFVSRVTGPRGGVVL
jgi:alpha-methylacyl-CoA racemase